MAQLPALTSTQVVRALLRAGFAKDRQKGSHLILWNAATNARTVVPVHAGKTIKKPLLRKILHDAELTIEEFLRLL
jgi:predicted RNA binding protein YcfA (HicA-like mRNA interferase family)